MTREEARYYLQSSEFSEEQIATIEQAFKQEPCEDCIRRQDAYKCLEIYGDYDTLNEVYERLQKLPSVKPQEKTGHWISMYTEKQSHIKDGMVRESVKCSECDEWLTASDEYDCYGRYCPNCGAKMVEPQERSDKE